MGLFIREPSRLTTLAMAEDDAKAYHFPDDPAEDPAENPPENGQEDSPETAPENGSEKALENHQEDSPEKTPEKAPKKISEKTPDKTREKSPKKALEKLQENPLEGCREKRNLDDSGHDGLPPQPSDVQFGGRKAGSADIQGAMLGLSDLQGPEPGIVDPDCTTPMPIDRDSPTLRWGDLERADPTSTTFGQSDLEKEPVIGDDDVEDADLAKFRTTRTAIEAILEHPYSDPVDKYQAIRSLLDPIINGSDLDPAQPIVKLKIVRLAPEDQDEDSLSKYQAVKIAIECVLKDNILDSLDKYQAIKSFIDTILEGSNLNPADNDQPTKTAVLEDLNSCRICKVPFGQVSPRWKKAEVKAYLPCGHAFGHVCLFKGLVNGGYSRCPRGNCIFLRHECRHRTIPRTEPPPQNFTDTTAENLPLDCEFCHSEKGSRKVRRVARCQQKTNKWGSWAIWRRVAMRDQICSKLFRMTENHLSKKHQRWLDKKFKSFEKLQKRASDREDAAKEGPEEQTSSESETEGRSRVV
ncbi:hypothetical protein B0T10DRAFT_592138 [Thelonectria olida]|uniref:RING-type domain-containing protein n=1 Tax=Thelonectria olida TaxID=1576542 RepID=A0A9P9AUU5_9HYPO|nr:hypothetical protein B0T10DRAFT_592138 [Thelonectria olida]